MPGPPDDPTPDLGDALRSIRRVLVLIRPYWPALGKAAVLSVVVGVIGMAAPFLTKLLIDEVYPTENLGLMHVLVAAILGTTVASALLASLAAVFTLVVNSRLASAARLLFFNHLQHLPARFFAGHRVGEITSRFHEVGYALDSLSHALQTVVVQGAYLLLVPPVLILLDWRLAAASFALLPITLGAAVASGPVLRRSWRRSSEARAELAAFQVEVFTNVRTFKSMGLEHRVFRQARELVDASLHHQVRAGGVSHLFGALHGILDGISVALVTWLGWRFVLGREMSLGELMAYSAYLSYLQAPLHRLVELFTELQQTSVHLGRMFEYLDEAPEQDPEEVYDAPRPIARPLQGRITLEGVGFGYTPESPVLRDLDLRLEPGSITAVVGASGSGKTSLLNLLAGLERPSEGSLRVDDTPIELISRRELRRQIAVVWQEISLIRGTIWDNLTLGAETAERRQVAEAVRACGLEEVIARLPAGYETLIGEGGANLSAGQCQRLALARALVRRTPLLLLDEATANVDAAIERRILDAVLGRGGETGAGPEGSASRTVVYVTHRIATAALADQILVLDDGRPAGVGSHRDLLATCRAYRDLVEAAEGPGTPEGRRSGRRSARRSAPHASAAWAGAGG